MIILNIPLHYQFVQGKGNIVSDMDGDKVLMNIANGRYYNLGKIGGRIWELIATPNSAIELVTKLLSEYDVEQTICEEHVISFLRHLLDEKLIYVGENL
ncbi:lasso peptide biosynthesis PqqD family chaperone [Paenibacillus sp. 2RAB27]|uniref:lasso peptide biosynthesis PqqD family chaperone n=1 Tax=Paenibacillus sp. 2RAB27 TaxID=3232991 RepID=UPI003F9D06DF